MSPTLNGNSVIQCFKHSNVIEIHDKDFYMGLPHMWPSHVEIEQTQFHIFVHSHVLSAILLNLDEICIDLAGTCSSVSAVRLSPVLI